MDNCIVEKIFRMPKVEILNEVAVIIETTAKIGDTLVIFLSLAKIMKLSFFFCYS